MLWILEPQAISNFTDRKTGIENTVFRYSDQLSLYILLCRISGLFFNQVAKIIRRQMQGIGTILNRRKPYDLRFLRLKIIVQQILEASQNIFIHMAASNKLPVIKPNAIIQEQFYIIYNQCLAMLIDSMYNPQNEMFQRFKTKCSFLQNEAYLCKSFFLP